MPLLFKRDSGRNPSVTQSTGSSSFLSNTAGLAALCTFAGIFVILFIIAIIYAYRRYPNWRRKEREQWVQQRREIVRRQQSEAEETRRKNEVAMCIRRTRESQEASNETDRRLERDVLRPEPSYAGATRTDSLPPYGRTTDTVLIPPVLPVLVRSGSESSVPPYRANQ